MVNAKDAAPWILRDASVTECDALTSLCMRSKAAWGYDDVFMAHCQDSLRVTPERMHYWRFRVAASPDGETLGLSAFSVRSNDVPIHAELEMMFVEPGAMQRGVGRALLDDVRQLVVAEGARALWVLSDPFAEPFYRSHGAVRIGMRPSDALVDRLVPWLRIALDSGASRIKTPRLRLRHWRASDREHFATMNGDERTARYLPSTLTREQSDALADRIERGFVRQGFGCWAVERADDKPHPFIGFVGLAVPAFEAHFTPCIEIGWRLEPEHWGYGLATEAAHAVVKHAFEVLRLDEIVSFTVPANLASRRVMEKLGMSCDPNEDFDHPALAEGHPLRRHVLYRLKRGAG